jgi:hypothetical protein
MSSFKVRTSEYNTSNLQDLGASLSQFIISPTNHNIINLTPSQLKSISTNPILLIPSPGTGYYNIVDKYTSSLNFITGATQYTLISSNNIIYGSSGDILAGVNFDANCITDNVSNSSSQFSTGISAYNINQILNMPIYLAGSGFANGTSNVKIVIYYTTYSFP